MKIARTPSRRAPDRSRDREGAVDIRVPLCYLRGSVLAERVP